MRGALAFLATAAIAAAMNVNGELQYSCCCSTLHWCHIKAVRHSHSGEIGCFNPFPTRVLDQGPAQKQQYGTALCLFKHPESGPL
jgi:hypothetical protein